MVENIASAARLAHGVAMLSVSATRDEVGQLDLMGPGMAVKEAAKRGLHSYPMLRLVIPRLACHTLEILRSRKHSVARICTVQALRVGAALFGACLPRLGEFEINVIAHGRRSSPTVLVGSPLAQPVQGAAGLSSLSPPSQCGSRCRLCSPNAGWRGCGAALS